MNEGIFLKKAERILKTEFETKMTNPDRERCAQKLLDFVKLNRREIEMFEFQEIINPYLKEGCAEI